MHAARFFAARELDRALEKSAEADAPGFVGQEVDAARAQQLGLDAYEFPVAGVVVLAPVAHAALDHPVWILQPQQRLEHRVELEVAGEAAHLTAHREVALAERAVDLAPEAQKRLDRVPARGDRVLHERRVGWI